MANLGKKTKTPKKKSPLHADFASFETSFANFESYHPFLKILKVPIASLESYPFYDEMGKNRKAETPFSNLGVQRKSSTIIMLIAPSVAHPDGHALASALFESEAEGAVAAVTAFVGQLLGDDGLAGSCEFLVAGNEVVDAQIVDIGIIGDTLTGEILTEIVTVCAYGLG